MGRIVRVEAWPVNVPLETPYLMAIGRYPGMSRTVVRVTTADGVVGLGETGSAADADALNGGLGAGLVGRETDELRTTLGRADLPRPDHRSEGRMTTAGPLTGVEIALWDIAGHEAEQPLYDLLGGAIRREIPFTEYFAYREGIETTRTDVARYCARMIEQHDSLTFEGKVAVRPPEDDVKLVREIRAAINLSCAGRLTM